MNTVDNLILKVIPAEFCVTLPVFQKFTQDEQNFILEVFSKPRV